MNKLLLTILVLVSSLALSLPLQAATLKIATIAPEGSTWMTDMKAGAAEIKTLTEGRVILKFYGGGVMGNDQKVLSRIRIGGLQGGAFTPTALVNQYSDLNLYGLPMLFQSAEEASYVRGKMDANLSEGLEEAGYVSFGFSSGSFAILMSSTPITSLEEMKGKKVWIPEGDDISRRAMEALELTPVTLPMTDVLTGLQTGLIDVVGMSPIGALVLQWHTKIKYIVDLPLVYTFGFMAVDRKAFYKLSDADQAIVRAVMGKIYAEFDEAAAVDNVGAIDAMLNTGIELVEFELDDYEEVRADMTNLNEGLANEDVIDKALYEQMLGYLADYREMQGALAEAEVESEN